MKLNEEYNFFMELDSTLNTEKHLEFYIFANRIVNNISISERIKISLDKVTKNLTINNLTTGFKKVKEISLKQINKLSYNLENPIKIMKPMLLAFMLMSSTNLYSSDTQYEFQNKHIYDIKNPNRNHVQLLGNIQYNSEEQIEELISELNDIALDTLEEVADDFVDMFPEKEKEIEELFNKKLKIVFDFRNHLLPSANIYLDTTTPANNNREITLTYNFNELDIEKTLDNMDEMKDFIEKITEHEKYHALGVLFTNWETLFPEFIAMKGQQEHFHEEMDEEFLEHNTHQINKKVFTETISLFSNILKTSISMDNKSKFTQDETEKLFKAIEMTTEFFKEDIDKDFKEYKKHFYEVYNGRNVNSKYSILEYSESHLFDNYKGDIKSIIKEYIKKDNINLMNPTNSVSNVFSFKVIENLKKVGIANNELNEIVLKFSSLFESLKSKQNPNVSEMGNKMLRIAHGIENTIKKNNHHKKTENSLISLLK